MKNWIKRNKSIIIGLLAITIIIIGLYELKAIRDYHNGKISYKGRTYFKSSSQVMDTNMKRNFDAVKPTGKYILGNEVYDIKGNPNNSTIIFLKTRDGRFEIYELSGGP